MVDLENPGIVPVIRLKRAARVPRLLQALHDGGIRAADLFPDAAAIGEFRTVAEQRGPVAAAQPPPVASVREFRPRL